jgi:hypothetical protein
MMRYLDCERSGPMNLNDNPTIEQFRDLLRQHDDHAGHHALWVRKDGEVMLTCLPRSNPRRPPTYEHPDMLMRYGTFPVGYGHVGPEAAESSWFMGEVFKNMVEQWAKLKDVAGMNHIDLSTIAPYGRPVDAEEAAEIRRGQEEAARRKRSGQSGRCSCSGHEQETSLAHRRDV